MCISWLLVRFDFDSLYFFLHWSTASLCPGPHINQPPFLWLVQGDDLKNTYNKEKQNEGEQNISKQ